jgi:hypothetical protein
VSYRLFNLENKIISDFATASSLGYYCTVLFNQCILHLSFNSVAKRLSVLLVHLIKRKLKHRIHPPDITPLSDPSPPPDPTLYSDPNPPPDTTPYSDYIPPPDTTHYSDPNPPPDTTPNSELHSTSRYPSL